MQNVTYEVKNGELIVRCKLDRAKAQPTKNGKAQLLASTHGIVGLDAGKLGFVRLSLNLTMSA